MNVAAESAALAAAKARPSSRFWSGKGILLFAPLLPIAIFMPALLGHVLLAPGDGYLYYLPVHKLAAEAWSAGHLPAWNPFQLSGAPLLAGQAGAFSPFTFLFILLPTVYANNVYIVANLAIGALGASLLARHLVRDNAAAVVAGFAFVSSGFMYGHIAHQAVIGGAIWMPWVLLGYDLLATRRSVPRFLLAAGSLALAAVSGHPQMFFVIVLVLTIYATASPAFADMEKRRRLSTFLLTISAAAVIQLLLPASSWAMVFFIVFFLGIGARFATNAARKRLASRRHKESSALWLWLLPTVVVLAVAIAAVQLLPTAAIAGETVRSWPNVGAATSYSFSGSHLILLLFPYLFGNSSSVTPFTTLYDGHWNLTELAGYPGLAAMVFAAAGLPRIRRDPRALALGAAALVALLIALGRSIGLGLLVALLPGYGQFRAWARYSVVVDLAIAIFAAYGVAHLRAAHRDRTQAVKRSWALAVALAAAGLLLPILPAVRHFAVSGREQILAVGLPIAAATLAASFTHLFRRFDRLAVGLCCLLVAADGALSFGAFFEWRHSPSPAQARALYSPDKLPPWGSVPRTPGGIDRYLFAGSWSPVIWPYFPQVTDLKAIRSANGYEPLLPSRYADVVGAMVDAGGINRPQQFLRKRSWLLDILRISAVVVPLTHAPSRRPTWFDTRMTRGGLVRYTYTPRLPAAFVIGKVRVVGARTAVATGKGQIPFDPAQAALVEGNCRSCLRMLRPGFAGTVTRTHREVGNVTADVVAKRAGLLVISESWFPGWTATVDGRRTPVFRTDSVVIGVPVTAGRHRVKLSYEPPGLRAGVAISGFTLGGFIVAPILLYTRRRRKGKSAAERASAR
jgi:hypothetical protein